MRLAAVELDELDALDDDALDALDVELDELEVSDTAVELDELDCDEAELDELDVCETAVELELELDDVTLAAVELLDELYSSELELDVKDCFVELDDELVCETKVDELELELGIVSRINSHHADSPLFILRNISIDDFPCHFVQRFNLIKCRTNR